MRVMEAPDPVALALFEQPVSEHRHRRIVTAERAVPYFDSSVSPDSCSAPIRRLNASGPKLMFLCSYAVSLLRLR